MSLISKNIFRSMFVFGSLFLLTMLSWQNFSVVGYKSQINEAKAHNLVAEQAKPAATGELSGAQWYDRFPTSTSTDDLVDPFKTNVKKFISALKAAKASVSIVVTYRPAERAYLMHYAFRIARENLDPTTVPPMKGVNINWVHTDSKGKPDLAASKKAAEAMVIKYQIVARPALNSRHTERKAIDMNISWSGKLVIKNGAGKTVIITTTPRTGAGNTSLHTVGASFNVIKLVGDAPHWSIDGH